MTYNFDVLAAQRNAQRIDPIIHFQPPFDAIFSAAGSVIVAREDVEVGIREL
jgi:hypothetical protein